MLPQQNQQFSLKAGFLSFLTKSVVNGILTGTDSVIPSNPPWKDCNAQLPTVPLKPYTDQTCGRCRRFSDSKSVMKAC